MSRSSRVGVTNDAIRGAIVSRRFSDSSFTTMPGCKPSACLHPSLIGRIHSAPGGLAVRTDKTTHHCGQRTRVVHDMAAVQEIAVAELPAGEISGHGDDLHPGRQRRLNSRRGVLYRQALLRLDTQLASG